MNLFILSLNPTEIAKAMIDKHVSKILLEAVQMLCTAMHVLEPGMHTKIYKMAHKNHPVSIWCRTSRENFEWTLRLIDCLHNEWRYRYDHTKVHKSLLVSLYIREHIPIEFPSSGLTPFAKAMPEEYKREDPVESYRLYYVTKKRFATWKKRSPPEWFKE